MDGVPSDAEIQPRSALSKVARVAVRLETLDHGHEARVLVRLAAAVFALVRARLVRELVGQEVTRTGNTSSKWRGCLL